MSNSSSSSGGECAILFATVAELAVTHTMPILLLIMSSVRSEEVVVVMQSAGLGHDGDAESDMIEVPVMLR